MGMGDDIMATVQARAIYEATGQKVRPTDYWSPVWERNPCFARVNEPFIPFDNKPGNRPYILGQTKERFIWNPNFKAVPGEIYPAYDDRAKGKIVIEPNVKGTVTGQNKAWFWERWQEVVDTVEIDFVQLGNGPWLSGVERIETGSFMEAVAVLAGSKGFIGTDGGLHHASAALDVPAVVLWGGLAPSEMLGYEKHINIDYGDDHCGMKAHCDHCFDAMDKITVAKVIETILELEWM